MEVRDWMPSPEDVGAVIRTRTKNRVKELGTFTDETRPTRDEIIPLIDAVVQRITARAGKIPDSLQALARRTAALGVACDVELGYFPEQVAEGRSPYEQLRTLYNEQFMELVTASQNDDADDTTGDIEALAVHSFPFVCDPIGLTSSW
jgi:hypothetical protein